MAIKSKPLQKYPELSASRSPHCHVALVCNHPRHKQVDSSMLWVHLGPSGQVDASLRMPTTTPWRPTGLVSQLTSGATRIIYRHLVGNQAVYSELLSVQLTMTHVPNVGIGYFLKTANLQRHWLVVNPIIFGDGLFMVMTWGWFMALGLPNYLVFTSFYNAQTWCPRASGPSLYRSNQSDCEELQILKESLCGKRVCIYIYTPVNSIWPKIWVWIRIVDYWRVGLETDSRPE